MGSKSSKAAILNIASFSVKPSIMRLTFLLILIATISLSCLKDTFEFEYESSRILWQYSNSFESSEDLADFENTDFQFSNIVPENGGDSSIFMSGDCFFPHTSIELGPAWDSLHLKFRIHARTNGNDLGGTIGWTTEGDSPDWNYVFGVNSPSWTVYESLDTLKVSQGEKFSIFFGAGGIAPGSLYIDLLEVYEVDK